MKQEVFDLLDQVDLKFNEVKAKLLGAEEWEIGGKPVFPNFKRVVGHLKLEQSKLREDLDRAVNYWTDVCQ